MQPALDPTATDRLAARIGSLIEAGDWAQLGRHLGAMPSGDGVAFVVWVPPPPGERVNSVSVELLVADETPDLTAAHTEFAAATYRMAMSRHGEFAAAVVTNVPVGDRHRIGAFYRFIVTDGAGTEHDYPDALAASVPFGVFAPAEVVDIAHLPAQHESHFRSILPDGEDTPRIGPPVNLLQVHVATATAEGTLAALTRRIHAVADAVRSGRAVAPEDEIWLDYDAIELMPVEPTIEHEAGPMFWEETATDATAIRVTVRRPDIRNWGYDVIISGGAAVNPSILETGRPHELSDLAEALHRFPDRPIRLVLDLVYGHADNQAVGRVPPAWFTGPDMYGQHLDYLNPVVRMHLLEMQRRKAAFGADGLRIDGAQDFTWWNAEQQRLEFDDRYMLEMSDVVQEAGIARYRPWMVFEDGRPWPRPDWELASSYRAVTERQDHVVQWGPLTFAHNTPFLVTFWVTRWWRLREITEVGAQWISGCANHDTLRRGTQVDPRGFVNRYLGATLPEIIARAYDHPAATLLFHAFLPGIPMDFLQGIWRAPWSFVRTTDHRFAIKVWGEESRFLDWRVDPELYGRFFPRLRALGFDDLDRLRAFMAELAAAVDVHADNTEPVVSHMQAAAAADGFPISQDWLIGGYRAWMEDVHEFCVVESHPLDAAMVQFDRRARAFRQARPWLRNNLGPNDRFDYRYPTAGSVVFYGVRHGPQGQRLLFVANMEGAPATVVPAEIAPGNWQPALVSPGVAAESPDAPVTLTDGTGLIFIEG